MKKILILLAFLPFAAFGQHQNIRMVITGDTVIHFYRGATELRVMAYNSGTYPSQRRYVSTSGNNGNDGLTEATAWATLPYAAANIITPGDTICLKRGDTWALADVLEITHGGNSGNDIIWDGSLWGDPGDSLAILRSSADGTYNAAVHIVNCQYLTFKNIIVDVANKNKRGIIIGGADDTFGPTDQNNEANITIQGCTVIRAGRTDYYAIGIDVQPWNTNISNILIDDNKVDDINNQGIAFYPGRTDAGAPGNYAIINSQISNNIVTNCGMGGTTAGSHIHIGQDNRNTIVEYNAIVSPATGTYPGIIVAGHQGLAPTDLIIRYNDVRMATGYALGVIQGEAHTASVYYNKFYSNSTTANAVQIVATDGEAYTGCLFNIYNNTIVSATKVAFSDNSNVTGGVNFKNNLLIGNENTSDYAGNPGHTSLNGSMVHTNNTYWRLKTGTSATLFVHGATYVPRSGLTGYEATGIITDPLLTNEAGFDWTLQAGSPCINAGVDVGLTEDYAGDPIVGVPDIGAYEYQP